MNLIELFKRFPSENDCIEYLESVRFKNGLYCVYCGSKKVCKHNLTTTLTRNANRL
jgi:hypothetical protein